MRHLEPGVYSSRDLPEPRIRCVDALKWFYRETRVFQEMFEISYISVS